MSLEQNSRAGFLGCYCQSSLDESLVTSTKDLFLAQQDNSASFNKKLKRLKVNLPCYPGPALCSFGAAAKVGNISAGGDW
jgi:hypothetical protein